MLQQSIFIALTARGLTFKMTKSFVFGLMIFAHFSTCLGHPGNSNQSSKHSQPPPTPFQYPPTYQESFPHPPTFRETSHFQHPPGNSQQSSIHPRPHTTSQRPPSCQYPPTYQESFQHPPTYQESSRFEHQSGNSHQPIRYPQPPPISI